MNLGCNFRAMILSALRGSVGITIFCEGLAKPTEPIHKLETYATAVGSGRGGTPRAESSMKPVSIPKSCSNNLELMRLDS